MTATFFLQITANPPYPWISNRTRNAVCHKHVVQKPKLPIPSPQLDQLICTPYVTKGFENDIIQKS